jgi:hypothetical protein
MIGHDVVDDVRIARDVREVLMAGPGNVKAAF